jgi:hypothetical protein
MYILRDTSVLARLSILYFFTYLSLHPFQQDGHYKSKQMLLADLMLMINNCKLYNEEVSLYVLHAVRRQLATLSE